MILIAGLLWCTRLGQTNAPHEIAFQEVGRVPRGLHYARHIKTHLLNLTSKWLPPQLTEALPQPYRLL